MKIFSENISLLDQSELERHDNNTAALVRREAVMT